MAVLILESANYSRVAIDRYGRLGTVWLESAPGGCDDHVRLLVVRLGKRLDECFLNQFPNLSAIATPTTGLTHIDIEYCRRRGLRIFSLQDCRAAIEEVTSTSELTVGLMLALLRRIPQAHSDVVERSLWDRDRYRSRQLSRMTLGIVGMGRIGRHVAGYANAFGMRVLAVDPALSDEAFNASRVSRASLPTLLHSADIVSLHADLRPDNRQMIGASELGLMKRGALLVNTARGALLDETAVVAAVRSGALGGAAVDVLESEHSADDWSRSALVAAAREGLNVIVTPHIGGCTSDAMHITEERLAEFAVEALEIAVP